MPPTITDKHTKLLELLISFDSLCRKHSLNYQLAWGTLLGAVRHKGFIPWDDDVDVMMPLRDYRQLLYIFENEIIDGFELLTYKGTKGYYFPFLRFVFKKEIKSTAQRDNRRYDALWLDVFPLLPVPPTFSHSFHFWKRKRRFTCRLLALKSTPVYKCSGMKKVIRLLSFCVPEKCLRMYLCHSDYKFAKRKTELVYVQDLWEIEDALIAMPAFWFRDAVLLQFEGHAFVGPRMFDAILAHYYGDYMTLPPPEMQKSRHG